MPGPAGPCTADRWLLLAGVVGLQLQQCAVLATTHVASDAPIYYRVKVPKGATAVRIHAEADRPLALMAAFDYFPTESHYDVANFPDWALGRSNTTLRVPVDGTSPCDVALQSERPSDGLHSLLSRCLARMEDGDGLQCGAVADAGGGSLTQVDLADGLQLYSSGSSNEAAMCGKYVDACQNGTCAARRGPAVCNVTDPETGDGNCLCQRGFCEVSGRCVGADYVESGCAKIVGKTCPYYTCDASLGATNCEDGLCVCQPGHCAVNGQCVPGKMCEELGMQGLCDAGSKATATPAPSSEITSRRLAAAAADADCCRLLDTARAMEPGTFARCAAQRFFSLQTALARGIAVPQLRVKPLGSGTRNATQRRLAAAPAGGGELVLSVRASESRAPWAAAPALLADGGSVAVRLSIRAEGPGGGSGGAAPGSEPERFHTFQELVSPLGPATPSLRQLEPPLLQPEGGADRPVRAALPGALPLRLRRGKALVLRLAEEALSVGQENAGGLLQLHAVGVPEGSSVLYARSWPEPRSQMDFGHAELVAGEPQASVWSAGQLSARHFMIVPSEDTDAASVFFAVHPLLPPAEPEGLLQPEATRAPDERRQQGLRGAGDLLAALASLLAAALAGTVCSAFRRCRRGATQSYSAVPTCESSAAASSLLPGELSCDEAPGAAPAALAPLQAFGEAVKETMSQRDFAGIGEITRRLLSVSTRAGTTRRSTTRRSDGDDDFAYMDEEGAGHSARGLLAAEPEDDDEDEAAMDAVMKLMPAARDSLGGDECNEENEGTPLVGSERLGNLLRG